jgi:fructose-1,6-bisphosphatase/inositol monophosphatase family enzyme
MTDLAKHTRVFAQALALEAAHLIQQAAGQPPDVEFKSAGDWCSALDRSIEEHLRARIAQAYPEHGFLG